MMRSYQKNIKPLEVRFNSVELNVVPAYDDRYKKNKIRTYGDKVYTNFRGLNGPEDDIKF